MKENKINNYDKPVGEKCFLFIRRNKDGADAFVMEVNDKEYEYYNNQISENIKPFFNSITQRTLNTTEVGIENKMIRNKNCYIVFIRRDEIQARGFNRLPMFVNFNRVEKMKENYKDGRYISGGDMTINGDILIFKSVGEDDKLRLFEVDEAVNFWRNLILNQQYASEYPRFNPVFQMREKYELELSGDDFFNLMYPTKEQLQKEMN